MSIQRINTKTRYSPAVVANGFVFVAGQVATDTSKSVAGQTAEILAKIDELLESAGSDKSRIVQAMVWVADYRTSGEMNEVWDAWVPQGQAPARACVEAALAAPEYKVEIAVTAVV